MCRCLMGGSRWVIPLACGLGHPELSKSYMDTAGKLFTFTFTFLTGCFFLHADLTGASPRATAGARTLTTPTCSTSRAWRAWRCPPRCDVAALEAHLARRAEHPSCAMRALHPQPGCLHGRPLGCPALDINPAAVTCVWGALGSYASCVLRLC